MPKPFRSPLHLAFVRSLPCCICFRTFGVEAAHVGRRGMSQKCSDLDTIPLCNLHHREQHRIGLRHFCASCELDIPALLEALQEKPRMFVRTQFVRIDNGIELYWLCSYRGECFRLLPVALGPAESFELAKIRCREYLIETYFHSERERRPTSDRFR